MTFHIRPADFTKFEHKFNLMTKYMNPAPKITYSEPRMERQVITRVHNGGYSKKVNLISLITVDIEDVAANDWMLVSSVFYKENIITMVNKKYYDMIPEQYGLSYTRCDLCGKVHANRNDAHILYNENTGEWMQVGSSCINKQFNFGKYLSTFVVRIYKMVSECNGYFDGECEEWVRRQPDHYFMVGIPVAEMITAANRYYNTVSNAYHKGEYSNGYRIGGTANVVMKMTNDIINDDEATYIDYDYINNVKNYVSNLESSDFADKVKSSIEYDYTTSDMCWAVFFAVKMYNDSLTVDGWETIKQQYPCNIKMLMQNMKIDSIDMRDTYFGVVSRVTFINEKGHRFVKNISSVESFMSRFMDPNTNMFNFKSTVFGYDDRKRTMMIDGAAKITPKDLKNINK